MCRFNDGVIAATTGHINVHESGAIEACGHKVVPVDGIDGKIDLDALERYLTNFYKETAEVGIEHYVMPRAIYISTPTELGTVYTLPELQRLRTICDTHGFYLYIDGARLGYALAAEPSVTLPHIARLADAFYIGGTKVGALFGEAVVITNPNITFTRGLIKHRGAMLAKGWLLGVQFDTLMTNDLYLTIARNAVAQAQTIKQALVERAMRCVQIRRPINCFSSLATMRRRLCNNAWTILLPPTGATAWCAYAPPGPPPMSR